MVKTEKVLPKIYMVETGKGGKERAKDRESRAKWK